MRQFNHSEKCLKPEYILVAVVTLFSLSVSETMADDYFSPDSIEIRGNVSRDIDLSQFSHTGGQAPGIYRVAIYLNGTYVTEREVTFSRQAGKLAPELTPEDLLLWGVAHNATAEFMQADVHQKITDPGLLLPESHFAFDFPQSRLNISVPQQYVLRNPQGYIPEQEWDDGVNMAFLNYSYSGATTRRDGAAGVDNSAYLNLRSGVNLGAWRLRHYGAYTHSDEGNQWDNINTYLQRDVKSLKSQFVVGEGQTQSEIFDSFAFRGAQLYSDDNMLPESLRGFAPIVRGIAHSNAQVTIRQNGSTIWQSYVPPGPFAISDLYPTSSSGELEIVILESDGTQRRSVQPFSAVPVMQREGRFKYSVAAGNYRSSDTTGREPTFFQGTGIYGLPWTATVYGGSIISDRYFAAAVGLGKSLGDIGSVSLDGTFSRTQFADENDTGGAFRFQYSKDIATSGTTFTVLGYRYSTSGYHDFSEANGDGYSNWSKGHQDKEERRAYEAWRGKYTKRSRTQANINQSLGDYGSLYLSVYEQQYWGGDRDRNVNAGFNTSHNDINYSLSYGYAQTSHFSSSDQTVSLSVQIPLSRFLPGSWLSASATSNKRGDTTLMTGLSGTALADNNLSWSVMQGYNSQNANTTGSAAADYKSRTGEYQAGYNYSRQNQQFTYGAQGGVVLHPYGLTLTQPLGETMALVKAQDAAEVKVLNNSGLYTNRHGYAVVPYVTPYHRTHLTLDTTDLGQNVDLLGDTRTIVPTNGALALADFPTASGQKVMFTLQGANVPFGATASVQNDNRTTEGIVDDQKRVWLTGVPDKGSLQVRWQGGRCTAPYQITASSSSVLNVTAACH
ncbi:TPA: fimbria/pilus outer membrane usher protein [Raoultella planticola]|uniref:Fimbrial biogenesis outer membrane usher protein n=1 Tax=Raoultella planticola TaxID=575 RepID=A0AAN5L2L2_RAOPL|nr:fimbrial biogenesis outer membrane usher protein [Raoultella planticola]HED2412474.1 fimbrial biogenesis outer membrane usher protein [Raoultella planticola]